MDAAPLQPPANPYGVKRASVECAGSRMGLPVGVELRVGRDPSRVSLLVEDPRVSGLHASLRFDGSVVSIRDEGSSLGVVLDGAPIARGAWVDIPAGAQLALGPVPLAVSVE